ncbi:MAG TPA: hypothetical protein DC049_12440 [Spirochaetia bacterium]|nr:hypothetical protein [Spirochaetia bacterium]
MWLFSQHIQTRLKQRNISKNEVLSIVNNEVDSIIIGSPKDESVDLYFSCINQKYIIVVANKASHVLITTRKMNKKEKMIFIQEIKNVK